MQQASWAITIPSIPSLSPAGPTLQDCASPKGMLALSLAIAHVMCLGLLVLDAW